MRLIQFIRNSYWGKVISVFLAINIFFGFSGGYQNLFALTGGPSQPEAKGFKPVGADDLVNLSSGDFSYNIPLIEVGGYPVNLSYNSNITMDQEASWVGLGWSLNTGAINRSVRGIPDDFSGEKIKKDFYMKPNITGQISAIPYLELFGFPLSEKLKLSSSMKPAQLAFTYNNYQGFLDISTTMSPTLSMNKIFGTPLTAELGVNVNSSMSGGMSFTPNADIKYNTDGFFDSFSYHVGKTYNNIHGVKSLNMSLSYKPSTDNQEDENDNQEDENDNQEDENDYGTATGRIGGSIDYAKQSFLPSINVPKRNFSFRGAVMFGAELGGGEKEIKTAGLFARQKYEEEINNSAYGYLYMQETNSKDVLLDFNREKDGEYIEGVTNHLPLAYYTPDIYNVNAQGLSGTFKPQRSDIGYIFDESYENKSFSGSAGVELTGGNTSGLGIDVSVNPVKSSTGSWENDASKELPFQKQKAGELYEPVSFRLVGALTANKNDNGKSSYEAYGEENAMRIKLTDDGDRVKAESKFEGESPDIDFSGGHPQNKNRYKRNAHFKAITYKEALQASYYLPRNDISGKNAKQIAAIEVDKDDGSTYAFAYPVYNNFKEEVIFAIDGGSFPEDGLVKYNDDDNKRKNRNGINSFYSKTRTPSYAHSFMLSAVYSPNYVDVTGDGPTDDDLGSYTKFKYDMHDDSYKWRTPSRKNYAADNQGNLHTDLDNKASYEYGTKEVVYLEKIESKTHIAKFYTSERSDGYGVEGENGGIDKSQTVRKLDSIALYSKDVDGSESRLIKTVHFEYYSDTSEQLGKDVPNADAGKLTLKRVYFTYGDSERGRYNFYKFDYNHKVNGNEVEYQFKGYDRWGNYKDGDANPGNLPNSKYPYVQQTGETDEYAGLWKINKVHLPSGGSIAVDYESDRYAYVQNKRAMQMINVKAVGETNSYPSGNKTDHLYNFDNGEDYAARNYLFFEIDNNLVNGKEDLLKEYYFKKAEGKKDYIENLYYKFKIKITGDGNNPEYISGYANIEKDANGEPQCGIADSNTGWVKIQSMEFDDGDKKANPIAKSGWRFVLDNAKGLAFDYVTSPKTLEDKDGMAFLNGLSSMIPLNPDKWVESLRNPFIQCYRNKVCQKFNQEASFIRLNNPDRAKYGGGSRVKEITVNDNWASMSGQSGTSRSYTKTYDYTIAEDGRQISSGVASYEPMIGGDENPYRNLSDAVTEEVKAAPDIIHYVEKPFGGSLMPSPRVVYRKVKVETNPDASVNKRRGKGYRVHRYYTAKDFPLKTDQTEHWSKTYDTGLESIDIYTKKNFASQGYSVITNNMHGKPKETANYNEFGELVSGEKYNYKTKQDSAKASGALDNKATVIYPDGTWDEQYIGIDTEIYTDFRESRTKSVSVGLNTDVNAFAAGILPCLVFNLIPEFSRTITEFNSASVTKHIHKRGILESKEVYDLSSSTKTENMAWDSQTGKVLLTKVKNDYDDNIYSFNYPVHWMYKGMQQSYINDGFEEYISKDQDNIYHVDESSIYMPGDKVLVTEQGGQGSEMAHILDVNHTENKISLIEAFTGKPISNWDDIRLKVIDPGRKNMQSQSAGSVVMKENPLVKGTNKVLDINRSYIGKSNTIINSSSQTWDAYAKMYCASCDDGCHCEYTPVYKEFASFFSDMVSSEDIVISTNGGQKTIDLYKPSYYNLSYTTLEKIFNISGINQVDDFNVTVEKNESSNKVNFTFTFQLEYNGGSTVTEEFNYAIDTNFEGIFALEALDFPLTGASEPGEGCEDLNGFSAPTAHYLKDTLIGDGERDTLEGTYDVTRLTTSNNIKTIECERVSSNFSSPVELSSEEKVVNPYHVGILGRWYPDAKYLYKSGREYTGDLEIRHEGGYSSFAPFWQNPSLNTNENWQEDAQAESEGWLWKNHVSVMNPHLREVENSNALDIFSSALFGFKTKLSTAVASNANYQEVASEGFENRANTIFACYENYHLDIENSSGVVTENKAHTGHRSYLIYNNEQFSFATQYQDLPDNVDQKNTYSGILHDQFHDLFLYDSEHCMDGFSIRASDSPQHLVVNFWFHDSGDAFKDELSNAMMFKVNGVQHAPEKVSYSHKIDGWRNAEAVFELPANNAGTEIQFKVEPTDTLYIDDFRCHPADANLKSYVYDYENWQLVAEMDQNNYGKLYEYDREGNLSRVKKETERGIVTLKETRSQRMLREH